MFAKVRYLFGTRMGKTIIFVGISLWNEDFSPSLHVAKKKEK